MLKIRKTKCRKYTKNKLTASRILSQITSGETFDVTGYFRPVSKVPKKLSKNSSLPTLKVPKQCYYDKWEIHCTLKGLKSFRSRKREVIDKIKLKPVESAKINFKLSQNLQDKLRKSSITINYA